MNEKFKERLISLRKEKNLTQDKFAELMGVSKSAISMYENGRRTPDFELEEKIADFFNVDLDYLRGRTDVKNKYQLNNYVSTETSNNIKDKKETQDNIITTCNLTFNEPLECEKSKKIRLAARNMNQLSDEDLDFIITMMEKLSKKKEK